jgi:hypothetical protein
MKITDDRSSPVVVVPPVVVLSSCTFRVSEQAGAGKRKLNMPGLNTGKLVDDPSINMFFHSFLMAE